MKLILYVLWAKTRFDENIAQPLNEMVYYPNFDNDALLNNLFVGI